MVVVVVVAVEIAGALPRKRSLLDMRWRQSVARRIHRDPVPHPTHGWVVMGATTVWMPQPLPLPTAQQDKEELMIGLLWASKHDDDRSFFRKYLIVLLVGLLP